MKKVILGISLLASFLYTAVACADDFTGLRFGVGYVHTWLTLDATDYDIEVDDQLKGIKLESGFDINRIIGIDASYETASESLDNVTNDSGADATIIKVGTDIGYAFYSEKAFFKPYVKVGFVSVSADDDDGYADGNSAFAGIGLRYQYDRVYADLSTDYFFIDGDDDVAIDYYNYLQTAFTIGYKF